MSFNKIANADMVAKVTAALEANGMNVVQAKDQADVLKQVQKIIPKGAEVMQMTSRTLDELGLSKLINESGHYDAVRMRLMQQDATEEERELTRDQANSPDFVIGSVHAITASGEVVVVSNTGSQLPAYAYGAKHVVWVVGTHKLVADLDTAMKRIYEYILPLESERVKEAYGMPHSNVSKILILKKEVAENRITVILVPEVVGF